MILKDFIKSIILDVGTAIEEIRIDTGDNYKIDDSDKNRGSKGVIHFDIAVTQGSENSKGGKFGVSVLAAKTGLEGIWQRTTQNVSRIQFDLMLNNRLDKKTLEDMSDEEKFRYSPARKSFTEVQ